MHICYSNTLKVYLYNTFNANGTVKQILKHTQLEKTVQCKINIYRRKNTWRIKKQTSVIREYNPENNTAVTTLLPASIFPPVFTLISNRTTPNSYETINCCLNCWGSLEINQWGKTFQTEEGGQSVFVKSHISVMFSLALFALSEQTIYLIFIWYWAIIFSWWLFWGVSTFVQ